jgi:hypothetical protein
MKDFDSLAHVRWECKYHLIFIPKYRTGPEDLSITQSAPLCGAGQTHALRAWLISKGLYPVPPGEPNSGRIGRGKWGSPPSRRRIPGTPPTDPATPRDERRRPAPNLPPACESPFHEFRAAALATAPNPGHYWDKPAVAPKLTFWRRRAVGVMLFLPGSTAARRQGHALVEV